MIPDSMEPVGQQVGPVGQHDRDRELDQVVVDEGHEPGCDEPGRQPDRPAHDDRGDEGDERTARIERHGQGADRDAEHDQPGAVVEQALALDDRGQVTRDVEPPECRDDRDGIGRRDHRPDDERQVQSEPHHHVEEDGDDRRRDDDARGGQQQERGERPSKVGQVEPVAGLEDETGKQDDEHDLGWDDRLRTGDRGLDEAGTEPDDDQRDRVRQPQRPDDDRDDRGQPKERDEDPDRIEDGRTVHGGPIRRRGRRSDEPRPSGPTPGPGSRPGSA